MCQPLRSISKDFVVNLHMSVCEPRIHSATNQEEKNTQTNKNVIETQHQNAFCYGW